MITPTECRREIDELMAVLTDAGLLVRSNATTVTVANGLTWVSWGREATGLPPGGVSISEYRRVLQAGEYNALLKDGGVLQLSFAFDRDTLVKHRLCWIPSPVVIDEQEIATEDVADLVDEALIAAGLEIVEEDKADTEADEEPPRTDLLLVAPVRFDFDLQAAKRDHAASHLTFNRATCRIPVYGPVSLGHFVRFTFRHFYAEAWKSNRKMQKWSLRFGERLVTPNEEEEIFLDCRRQSTAPIRAPRRARVEPKR